MKRKTNKAIFLVCKPGENLFPSTEWDRKPVKPFKTIRCYRVMIVKKVVGQANGKGIYDK